jgi:hypothetical protein
MFQSENFPEAADSPQRCTTAGTLEVAQRMEQLPNLRQETD